MQREIKFRAWDGHTMRFWGFIKPGMFQGIPTESGALEYPQMQYTGLKDRSGNEIYEGDIIQFYSTNSQGYRVRSRISVIKFQQSRSQAQVGFNIMAGNSKNREVVGNIYENANLLETA